MRIKQLETELAALRADFKRSTHEFYHVAAELKRERDEAKAELAAMRERSRKIIASCKEVLPLLRQYIDESGPCDHAVGICICGIKSVADDFESEIKRGE